MNVYKVTDSNDVWTLVVADNPTEAKRYYPSEYAEHCYLVERDVEGFERGDLDLGYLQSHGVDLVMAGIILPNWMISLGPEYDDYRNWNGFKHD